MAWKSVIAVVPALLFFGGCSSGPDRAATRLPTGADTVSLDPAGFTTRIDNQYWPMKPGSRWVFLERGGRGAPERVEITVTHRTKRMANGIVARVVHDVATKGGHLVEDTYDWFAQDRAGNVWYLGEATKEYEHGKVVSTEGSWEAGRNGAQPGIMIPATPRPGLGYRQEYSAGEAEDAARVLSLDEKVRVPVGFFQGVLMTKDWTPLEPRLLEHKFYAKRIGPVLTLSLSGERAELIRYSVS